MKLLVTSVPLSSYSKLMDKSKALTVQYVATQNFVSLFIQGKPGEPGKPGKDPRVSFELVGPQMNLSRTFSLVKVYCCDINLLVISTLFL